MVAGKCDEDSSAPHELYETVDNYREELGGRWNGFLGNRARGRVFDFSIYFSSSRSWGHWNALEMTSSRVTQRQTSMFYINIPSSYGRHISRNLCSLFH